MTTSSSAKSQNSNSPVKKQGSRSKAGGNGQIEAPAQSSSTPSAAQSDTPAPSNSRSPLLEGKKSSTPLQGQFDNAQPSRKNLEVPAKAHSNRKDGAGSLSETPLEATVEQSETSDGTHLASDTSPNALSAPSVEGVCHRLTEEMLTRFVRPPHLRHAPALSRLFCLGVYLHLDANGKMRSGRLRSALCRRTASSPLPHSIPRCAKLAGKYATPPSECRRAAFPAYPDGKRNKVVNSGIDAGKHNPTHLGPCHLLNTSSTMSWGEGSASRRRRSSPRSPK